MANTYKTVGNKPTTALATAYTCPAGKTAFVTLARVTNTSASTVTSTVNWYDASAASAFALVNTLSIPAKSTVRILEDRLILEAGDYIQTQAGANGALDIVLSVMEV